MFSRRRALDGSRQYSREFFEAFIADLRRAGFDRVRVRLPHNLVGLDQESVDIEAFLNRERNYPSAILVASNEQRQETLKVLFVNLKAARAVFVDDTFPNSQSEPPQLYFQSPDPARTYAVFEFFHEYLQRSSLMRHWVLWFATVVGGVVIAAEALSLLSRGRGFLTVVRGTFWVWDIVFAGVAVVVFFGFFSEPKGLWVKPTRELRLFYLVRMAARGELRDNPLVSLVVGILGAVITAVILKLLGLLGG